MTGEEGRAEREEKLPVVKELPKVPEEVVENIRLEVALATEDFIRDSIGKMSKEDSFLTEKLISASISSLSPRDYLIGGLSFYLSYSEAARMKGERMPPLTEETFKKTMEEEITFFKKWGYQIQEMMKKEDLDKEREMEEIKEIVRNERALGELIIGFQSRGLADMIKHRMGRLESPSIDGALFVRRLLKAQIKKEQRK